MATTTGSFRTTVWDPTLIIFQIICLQSAFYSAVSTMMFLWSLASGLQPTLAQMFTYEASKQMVLVQLLASFCCSLLLPVVVGRARQCLDFAITLHLLHLIAVCIYNRTFPLQLSWWFLQMLSCSMCTVMGEWLCHRRECAEIPLIVPKASGASDTNRQAEATNGGANINRLLEV